MLFLAAVRQRVKKRTNKYDIEMPYSVEEAIALDKKNENDFWQKAIAKEMRNNAIAFQILEPDEHVPVGWTPQSGHMVFDIKMDLTRKARWVLDGHKTPDIDGSTFAGVVSRESVCIAFTYAALNDLSVCAGDILNAYLQAPSSQKPYIICSAVFGIENIGKRALIKRALYGGKTAGKDFRDHLRCCMRHLNFDSCLSDPDLWMRPAVKGDGTTYYEYVLLYVDDCLVVSHRAEYILKEEIGKYFPFKPESIGPPDIYLGGQLRQVQMENGMKCWSIGSSKYIQAAIKNVEDYLAKRDLKLPTKANTPFTSNYRPELDVTYQLDPDGASYFQSLIGILRWIVELGRVDICLEVSMLSSQMVLPRKGHLFQAMHIFAYLKKFHNAEMTLDPSDPTVDMSLFQRQDWTSAEFDPNITEELPHLMPEPRGKGFTIRAFVDADHAGDTITRRSRSGFLVFLNMAPIYWTSKKQTSVETSSFGSEFTAMKQCTEYIRGLRYKLRMMGSPCD